MTITALPTAPLPTDSTAVFNNRAFSLVAALNTFVTETNATAAEVNADKTSAQTSVTNAAAQASSALTHAQDAEDYANASASAANFIGEWSTLTGPLSIPASVSHNKQVWILTQNLANVAANTPSAASAVWVNATTPRVGSLQAIASGSLSDGSTVIVNADGTVSVVAASGGIPVAGTPVVYNSSTTNATSAIYDAASNRVVIAYAASSQYQVIVGTVSGASISFGTPVSIDSSPFSGVSISAAYDSTNSRIVIAYADGNNSNFGTAIVGTVSGTSISFGTAVVFESATTTNISATYNSTSNRVVIAYQDQGNSNFGTAIVGTVSGTSISFGTAVVFESAATFYISATYDSTNNRVVIAYTDNGNSNRGTAIVGTVSGTSISFGTAVVFESALTLYSSATYDSTNNRVVIAYTNGDNSSYGTARVGTVSGTSISFGSAVVFRSAGTESISATYDSTNNRVVIAYRDLGNSNFGTAIVGTVSGTSISFGTAVVFESAQTNFISATYNSTSNRVVIAYRDEGNSNYGTSVVFQTSGTNLTSENFIGISSAAYTNGQTAAIQIVGSVDDAQTGLTAGQSYYVQDDGTLGLTPAAISVFAGTAVSATKIIIKG